MKTAQVKHEIVNVTPEKAKKWMAEANGQNFRKPNDRIVDSYASDMRIGKWAMNGESIKFDSKGVLVDGQHRLAACAQAGKPFDTLIIWGCDKTDDIDTGFKRTYAQILSNNNVKAAAVCAASVKLMSFLDDLARGTEFTKGVSRRRSTAQLRSTFNKYNTIEDFVAKSNEVRKLCSPTYVSAVMCWSCNGEWVEPCSTFVVGLRDPSKLHDNSPVFALGRRLRNVSPSQKITRDVLLAITIIAWNHHIAGKTLSVLRWFKTDKFPLPNKIVK